MLRPALKQRELAIPGWAPTEARLWEHFGRIAIRRSGRRFEFSIHRMEREDQLLEAGFTDVAVFIVKIRIRRDCPAVE